MKLKFITLNIEHGGNPLSGIIEFIKKEKPDILLLQEVYDGKNIKLKENLRSYSILGKTLNYKYSCFSPFLFMTKDGKKIPFGNAVFSHFPITKSTTLFFNSPPKTFSFDDWQKTKDYSFTPKGMLWLTLNLDNRKIYVGNVHGVWGMDGFDNRERLKMSQKIVSQIKDKANVILAGDFNVSPNTKTILAIEKYLKNVFKNELQTTFNLKRKSKNYAAAVVDMMFVSPNIKILGHFCPPADISDHLPLVAVLEV